MNKDYAKKRRSRYTKKSSFEPVFLMPSWAWMILGISLGVGASALVYWKTHQKNPPLTNDVTITMEDKSGKTKLKTLAKNRGSSSAEGGARFDFYTLLPNMAQESLETLASTATAPSPPPAPTLQQALAAGNQPSEPFTYTIQVGSFRQLNQAEELKAKLVLSGFTASIQTYKLGSKETWHRVTIGPYSNKEQALASQQKLEQTQALHSLLIKNRV